jgi:mono/diheme cytochrome c family protein
MGLGKKLVVGGGAVVALALLAGIGGFSWASMAGTAELDRTYEVHDPEIPMPWPLSEAELDVLRAEKRAAMEAEAPAEGDRAAKGAGKGGKKGGDKTAEAEAEPEVDLLAGVDLEALAMERAVERGDHLVNAMFVCVACHAPSFGGGVMVDDPALGSFLGPNLTLGEGSVTRDYTMADWDHIVRHGIKPSGKGAIMPSEDYLSMSDRELSDVVGYIRSLLPVDNTVAESTLGPLGRVLYATGQLTTSAGRISDHTSPTRSCRRTSRRPPSSASTSRACA